MDFKNGVINIQAADYNGACTVNLCEASKLIQIYFPDMCDKMLVQIYG